MKTLFFVICFSSYFPVSSAYLVTQKDDLDLTSGEKKPNVIIMLMDDMGYGDLGCFGEPSDETPRLNQMAKEGVRMTDFYSGNPLCSPSRAALLTGRLPVRNGFFTTNAHARDAYTPQVIVGGIQDNEYLISEFLKDNGYFTGIVGKWHLGHQDQFLPLKHGFDYYWGAPNCHFKGDDVHTPNIPVYHNDKMVGRYYKDFPIDTSKGLSNLTQILTQKAVEFIEEHADDQAPFFLFWTPDSTHAPVYASQKFRGLSKRDKYGDAVMELDWGVGEILDTLKRRGIANDTFVFFTSDNGAALISAPRSGGSNSPFLCGKETTFEGGMREPAIAWAPGFIQSNVVSSQLASVTDLYATIADLADLYLPEKVKLDSKSFLPALTSGKNVNHNIFYYRGNELMAVRAGEYKAHRWTWSNSWDEYEKHNIDFCPGQYIEGITTHDQRNYSAEPKLFHLGRDPGEKYPIPSGSSEYQEIIGGMMEIINDHLSGMVWGEPQLNWCDPAVQNFRPNGCEELNQCETPPKSNPVLCVWNH